MEVTIKAQASGLCIQVKGGDGDCAQDCLPWGQIIFWLERERDNRISRTEAAIDRMNYAFEGQKRWW